MKKFFEEPQVEVLKLVSSEAITDVTGDMSVEEDWTLE